METPACSFFDAPDLEGTGTHRLAYLDWGDADAKNVVFCVHGLTRNAHDFDYLARELVRKGHRVIAPDMPGRGASERLSDPAGYNYAAYMADCLALMDNFHFRSVDWIGTSMGGIIGMMIAAMNPGRIRRLVLNDIGAFIPKDGLKGILDYVSAAKMHHASREEAEAQLRMNMADFGIDSEEHWQHVFTYSIRETADGFALAFDPDILAPIREETNDFTEIHDIDLSELWEAIRIPVLVLRGERSALLDKETLSAMRAAHLKCQTVEIPGVGHAPPLMKTEQIQVITRWLAGPGMTAIAV